MKQALSRAGRIMIAGTNSGCGKTTVVCGLLKCLLKRGLSLRAFKCGPDYIDPMFHRKVLGIPSGNLDSWFCDADTLKSMVCCDENLYDISVLEGAMGYYDGIGFSGRGSACELAGITDTPVVLTLNCRGMGASVEAVLTGFLKLKGGNMIKGVIFNQLPGRLYADVSETAIKLGIKPMGYIGYDSSFHIESRHLGLVGPDETADFNEKLERLSAAMEQTVDIDGIIELSGSAGRLDCSRRLDCAGKLDRAGRLNCFVSLDCAGKLDCPENKEGSQQPRAAESINIAVARDEAFCFYYEDNIRYLERSGCKIIYFSPLKDKKIPENIQGLILWGGYPERFAEELSENTGMLESVRRAVNGGLPCIAECGGFMYLHDWLEDERGLRFPMAGVIDGGCVRGKGLSRFGYMNVTANKDTLICKRGGSFKAHEFHYWVSGAQAEDYTVEKASDKSAVREGIGSDTLYAGFMHIYFYGEGECGRRFTDKCREYKAAGLSFLNGINGINAGLSVKAMNETRLRWNKIAKPLDSLGKFEDIIVKIAGVQETQHVSIRKKALVIMCADNGIVEENVTQSGREVTAIVAANMAAGVSSACRMAQYAGAEVFPVNIGIADEFTPAGERLSDIEGLIDRNVARGTKNFLKTEAMTEEQLEKALSAGSDMVRLCADRGINIIAVGEMGIGNTTTSAALTAVLLGKKPQEVTGYGAGLSDEGYKRKTEVVKKACEKYGGLRENPKKLLQSIGGFDIAGLTGVFLGAVRYRIPIVADGVISAAAALLAERITPGAKDFVIASHWGREPALKFILDELKLSPVIDANLALGEGTGAVMSFPLLDMAMRIYDENTTFEDINMEAYKCLR